MPGEDFERFRQVVLEDESLVQRLSAVSDWAMLVDTCVELARLRGIPLEATDAEQARIAARRAWFERWLTA